jgi:transposase-like protein
LKLKWRIISDMKRFPMCETTRTCVPRSRSRNGHTGKTVLLENQEKATEVPQDQNGTFEPIIVPKRRKRPPLFNDQII